MMDSRKVLGAEHPDTLTSMDDVASTYKGRGRWKEAKGLEMQVQASADILRLKAIDPSSQGSHHSGKNDSGYSINPWSLEQPPNMAKSQVLLTPLGYAHCP